MHEYDPNCPACNPTIANKMQAHWRKPEIKAKGAMIGAFAGAAKGSALGTAVAGPIGTLPGLVIGAIAGGKAGHDRPQYAALSWIGNFFRAQP